MLKDLIDGNEVVIYSAESDISHVAPPTSSADDDAILLERLLPRGWALRKFQGGSKGKTYLTQAHRFFFERLFIEGEEDSGKKSSAALMYQELRDVTTGRDVHLLPMLSEIAPFVSQLAQKRKGGRSASAVATEEIAPQGGDEEMSTHDGASTQEQSGEVGVISTITAREEGEAVGIGRAEPGNHEL